MDALALELVKPAPDASTLRRLVLEDCERPLTVQQRRKLWTVLLRVADRPTRPCDDDAPVDEERVLDADVRRTRRAECVTDAAQQDLRSLLRRFCASRGAPYRQGLNELAAPFSLLAPVDDELHALFDAFVSSFAAAFYASGSASTNRPLLRACGLFSALANYHDPELSHHLCSAGFSPALYATPWFLTLMARAAPDSLGHVLHIFDAWIALDDAGGVFYGSLALLRAHRSKLLEAAPSRLPHVFASLQLIGGASLALSAVVSEARALREATPHCLRGALKKVLVPRDTIAADASPSVDRAWSHRRCFATTTRGRSRRAAAARRRRAAAARGARATGAAGAATSAATTTVTRPTTATATPPTRTASSCGRRSSLRAWPRRASAARPRGPYCASWWWT
ncbi:rab-GTPase-TBC domain-containing protein [Pelagophyceae sp. CCMP2097]|nr:rab-GTPase-TBC domain-containing protein [Pelagophyceae sp. CCMP2097]